MAVLIFAGISILRIRFWEGDFSFVSMIRWFWVVSVCWSARPFLPNNSTKFCCCICLRIVGQLWLVSTSVIRVKSSANQQRNTWEWILSSLVEFDGTFNQGLWCSCICLCSFWINFDVLELTLGEAILFKALSIAWNISSNIIKTGIITYSKNFVSLLYWVVIHFYNRYT